jgi:hypothetical protein
MPLFALSSVKKHSTQRKLNVEYLTYTWWYIKETLGFKRLSSCSILYPVFDFPKKECSISCFVVQQVSFTLPVQVIAQTSCAFFSSLYAVFVR